MKALFLIFHGLSSANGISKKIHNQVQALKNIGIETRLCYLFENKGHKQRMVDDQVIASYGNGWKGKIYKRIEYLSITKHILNQQYDFVYMRSNHNANPFSLKMLYQLKRAGIPVVMEIPTYPYDQEYITPFMKLELFIDRCFRNILARQLSKIVTFSDYKTIFGIPTLQISNGIAFQEIPIKTHINDTSQELHLLGVAEIHYWHGFDRLIAGLGAYYSQSHKYKVYFHIVGELTGQREREEILPLIARHQLESYVIFHGALHGDSLQNLFEQCDMGIGSLGRHRSGIHKIKTLKNREYAARGIPFIYSETDEDFEQMPYILKAPADESPIDITRLVHFYQALQIPAETIRESVQNLSWDKQMAKVVHEIVR